MPASADPSPHRRASAAASSQRTGSAPHASTRASGLPAWSQVAVVCAHPDDETFGLGAIITHLVDAGTHLRVVSLTHGEGSTLGADDDLADTRPRELRAAAATLGVHDVTIHGHPDGALAGVPIEVLSADVAAASAGVEALLTFDHGGITGHPDHQRATDVAVAVGRQLGISVVGWALPEPVAAQLREEFGGAFVGRNTADLDHVIEVDRSRQLRAIGYHASQDNPVPRRRIELQGPYEHLRELHRPAAV